jgi:hypothetical protein
VVENLVEELQGDEEADEKDAATGPAREALTWLVASAIQLVLRYEMCVCVLMFFFCPAIFFC